MQGGGDRQRLRDRAQAVWTRLGSKTPVQPSCCSLLIIDTKASCASMSATSRSLSPRSPRGQVFPSKSLALARGEHTEHALRCTRQLHKGNARCDLQFHDEDLICMHAKRSLIRSWSLISPSCPQVSRSTQRLAAPQACAGPGRNRIQMTKIPGSWKLQVHIHHTQSIT